MQKVQYPKLCNVFPLRPTSYKTTYITYSYLQSNQAKFLRINRIRSVLNWPKIYNDLYNGTKKIKYILKEMFGEINIEESINRYSMYVHRTWDFHSDQEEVMCQGMCQL